MNEDERGITPRDVTAITVSLMSGESGDVFDRRWSVTIEQGNGDVLKMFELTEMERIQLGNVLSAAEVGETPIQHIGFVDFNRRATAKEKAS